MTQKVSPMKQKHSQAQRKTAVGRGGEGGVGVWDAQVQTIPWRMEKHVPR